MESFPSFDEFFTAANNGRPPFPWQARLARRVAEDGWPPEIGVPTGLGKTACIDIAVWALARDIAVRGSARSAATRTWYVVNRRLLVDTAYERGAALAELLASPTTSVIGAVASALRSTSVLEPGSPPLQVVRLRGGADLGERPAAPSEPALIFATVPMFASRLLFRGYGASNLMQSVDAALAGIDALVLLDEAHLSGPLLKLAADSADCDPGDPERLLPGPRSRAQVVSLTATGRDRTRRFDIDEADRAHPEVRRRFEAPKPTRLVDAATKDVAGTIVDQLAARVGDRKELSSVVFCNTVALTSDVARLIEKRLGRQPVVLTGRMRDREAEIARRTLMDPVGGVPSGREHRQPGEVAPIVVATQTLEVGADLDFDFLVTESAGRRAMVQRFGRLNRLGRSPAAAAVVVHADASATRGIYGDEPSAVRVALAAATDSEVDLSPATIGGLIGDPEDAPVRTGELLPAHLWEYAKTTIREPGEAPVEVFFDAIEVRDYDVAVVWRRVLPADGARLIPPTTAAEAVEVPIGELRGALEARGVTSVVRLATDRATTESVEVPRLRPGDVVVLPTEIGLYDGTGWNAEARERVLDLSPLTGNVPLEREVFETVVESEQVGQMVDGLLDQLADEPRRSETVAALGRLRDAFRAAQARAPYTQDDVSAIADAVDWSALPVFDDLWWLQARRRERVTRADRFDDASFEAESIESRGLSDHLAVVARLGRQIADRVGVPPEIAETVELAAAWHDAGKFDLRFQLWLDPLGEEPSPVAKSRRPILISSGARTAADWPLGARHELLSVRLLQGHLADADAPERTLALHLVAAHHGHGRPWLRAEPDGLRPTVSAEIGGRRVSADGDLGVPDFAQPARFARLCDRFGYWGLALMEAIVRQADHLASGRVRVA